MKRFIPLIFFLLFSIFFTNSTSLIWAHSGHKHDELKIKLPKVVARVNDHDINGDVIFRELKKAAIQYKKRGMPLTADQEKSAAKTLIDDEIGRILLVLKAKAVGIKVSEKMLLEKLRKVKAKFKSDSIFEHRLSDRGMTVDQYKQELEIDMYMDQLIKKEIEPKIKITEKDSQAYYNQNKSKFETQEKVRASIMLLRFNPKEGKAGEQAVLKKFESILKQLKNGADFGALALIKVTDRKPGGLSSFATEKEKIQKFLANKKISQATRDYIENLRKEAKIKTYF